MKSIRALTLSKEEEPPKRTSYLPHNDFDDPFAPKLGYQNKFDYEYDNSYGSNQKVIERDLELRKSQITITMIIDSKQITKKVWDKYDEDFDSTELDKEAISLAYDRLKDLIGLKFEQEYTTSYEVTEIFSELEVEATLTKITK